jgi:hypothetical protein
MRYLGVVYCGKYLLYTDVDFLNYRAKVQIVQYVGTFHFSSAFVSFSSPLKREKVFLVTLSEEEKK